MITILLSEPWVPRLGWTLLHFLWQGTAIVMVYAMLRSRLAAHSRSANGRYILACAALAAMAMAPLVTFLQLPGARGSIAPAAFPQAAVWDLSAAESQRLLTGVVSIWLLGVFAFSIRLLGGWRFTARLRATSHTAPAEWQQALEQIGARVGGSLSGAVRPVRLVISSLVDVPTVIGWLRPVILVPIEFLTGLPDGHLTALLTHEMAHIKRYDYLASILQSLIEAALFYHPAVWWISEQIRAERELCCDDLAVAAGADVLTYARALAELESRQPSRLKPALAANGGSLVNRIRRLIEPALANANTLPGPAAAWAMILLWLAGVGAATVHGGQTPIPSAPIVNLAPIPAQPVPAPPSPLAAFSSQARKTVLYDPFFTAQLAQPQSTGGANSTSVNNTNDALGQRWRDWLNEDVPYIITDYERAAFARLTSDEQRERFVEAFWLHRDPTPDTAENEYKDEYYRRIAFANERFSWRNPGWKTDRGRVCIIYGVPNEIEDHPSSAEPSEVWRYRFINGVANVSLEFVDTARTGEYRMTGNLPVREAPFGQSALAPPPVAASLDQFARLLQFAQLQRPPDVKFEDLEAAIRPTTTGNTLPMQVRVDYVPLTAASVMANVTVQFEAAQKPTVNLFGRVTTTTGQFVTTFQKPVEADGVPGNQSRAVYQQSLSLPPGRYRLRLMARDTVAGNLSTYAMLLDVPRLEEQKLAASSLILADTIERVPASQSRAMFVIGDTKVRPRVGNKFASNENMMIYLQAYNFGIGQTSQTPSGSIEYEVDKAGSNERIAYSSADVANIPNAAASQVTFQKSLTLRTFQPGAYTLKVTVTDQNGSQTLQRQGDFTISPE